MNEKLDALRISAHKAAQDGDYEKALEILDSLQKNHKLTTWDVVFYGIFYRYAQKGREKTSLMHVDQINQGVIEAFAVVLSQKEDILETLVCFQDIYDQIWDLSSRLQQCTHREYIGLVKGKSISAEFHQSQTQVYVADLKKILALSENFINALGNLAEYTTVNLDLIWDFFQCNDGLLSFLQAYDGGAEYEKKRLENLQIIQLKRTDYQGESLPTVVKPAEIRSQTEIKQKKKGFFSSLFQKEDS